MYPTKENDASSDPSTHDDGDLLEGPHIELIMGGVSR
jgi:hypothetical protein